MTQDRDFGQTPSGASIDEEEVTILDAEEETILDAIGEVFKFWVESKDGVVTWKTIDAAAKKHEVSPNTLGFVWQRVGFREKGIPGIHERTRALVFFFSHRRNRQWVER